MQASICHHNHVRVFIVKVLLQIPLPIAVHTLVRDLPSSLLWIMLAAVDQRLHSSHAPTPPVTTVHMLKMLVFNVCLVSVFFSSFLWHSEVWRFDPTNNLCRLHSWHCETCRWDIVFGRESWSVCKWIVGDSVQWWMDSCGCKCGLQTTWIFRFR